MSEWMTTYVSQRPTSTGPTALMHSLVLHGRASKIRESASARLKEGADYEMDACSIGILSCDLES